MSTAAIRIRMYRVGFGDCFLLSLPTDAGTEHILIDCGVHPRGDIGTMHKVVDNIAAETNKKLALVIGTHAHMDHLSGFGRFAEEFRRFQVREVWLPWTEDLSDPAALKLKNKHVALVQALQLHFAAKAPGEEIMAALANLQGNGAALDLLRAGIAGGAVSYLAAGKQIERAAGIDGLSARIFGPPRDEKFLAQMDLPVSQRFLRAAADDSLQLDPEFLPVDRSWIVEKDSNHYYGRISDKDRNLLAVAATSAEVLAFALDQIVNNTSIVALFTFAGKHLLFAGDAQYGNWRSWIEQPDGKAQLKSLHFYKVSHHGSLNATPKNALAAMPQGGFAAMISTQSVPWASIPRPDLVTALTERASGVVRSDSLAIDGAPEGPAVTQLPAGFERGPFWFDYSLPI